ncbi:hypothetical protein [Zooshikella ganghwensis]|uniref:hypothetical protein n=1 Tax=Zooshikella ganghwensis TaxID=202772 RepID=UPI0004175098|nr:hypothetical protein [Zooshikella ganghwensis]
MKSINSLLITISNILLIPSVTFAACSNTAPPDDTTVTCSGSSTSPISVLGDNVTINILKGADITSSLSVPLIDISSGNSNVIINNDGSLNKTNTTVFRISGREITVNNNSIINHSGGFFSYILLGITGSDNIRLINQGTVNYTGIGLPGGMLAGIYATSSSNNTVINQGTMNATGFSMIGVRLQYSSFMNNQGVFNFSADQGAAVKLENRSDSSLVNSGSIIVTDFTGTGGTAPTRYAVWSSPLLASTNTITNTATGIISIDQGSIAVFGSSYVEIVENQGQIFGGLNLGANNDRFTNTGIIVGNVELGDGDDIVITLPQSGRLDSYEQPQGLPMLKFSV